MNDDPFEMYESQLGDIPPIRQEQLINVTVEEVAASFDIIEPYPGGRAMVLGSRAVIHGSAASPGALMAHYEILSGQATKPPAKSPEATLMIRGALNAGMGAFMHGLLRVMGRQARRESGDDAPDRVAEEFAFHMDRVLATAMLFFGGVQVDPSSARGKKMLELMQHSVALGLYKPNDDSPALWADMFTDSLREVQRLPQKRKARISEHLGRVLTQAYEWVPEREKGRLDVDESPTFDKPKPEQSKELDTQPAASDNAEAEKRIADIKSAYTALIESGRDGSSFRLGSKAAKAQGLLTISRLFNTGYAHEQRNLALEDIDQSRTPVVLGLLSSLYKWTAENGFKEARTRLAQLIAEEQSLGAQLLDAHGTHGDKRLMTTLQDAVQWMRAQREVISQIIVDQEWPSVDWQTRVDFAADLGAILGRTDAREGWDWLFSPKENMVSGD